MEDNNECAIKTIARNSDISKVLRDEYIDVRIAKDVY